MLSRVRQIVNMRPMVTGFFCTNLDTGAASVRSAYYCACQMERAGDR